MAGKEDDMGLDILEFVMEIEERFDIEITDKDAQELNTARKVIDYVAARVPMMPGSAPQGAPCLTQRTFYHMRRVLMEQLKVPRDQIRPLVCLDALLPIDRRRAAWAALQRELRLPDLEKPAA